MFKDIKLYPTIISGLANGIDSLSHRLALENNLPTIAILGYSFNHLENSSKSILSLSEDIIKAGGLIITEFPNSNYLIKKEDFKIRNRLISGLCSKLLIIEAKNNSGTMITAKHALNQGKDIFCIPGAPFSDSGCNKLIQEGAYLFDNIKDLLL